MSIMNKFIALLLTSLFVVSGCATSPVSNNNAKMVSKKQIISNSFSQYESNSSRVTIKRDKGFFGSACSSRVYLNAEPIVDINSGEYYEVYLPSGSYILSAVPNGICSGGMFEVQFNIDKPTNLNYRIGLGTNGDYFIVPTAF